MRFGPRPTNRVGLRCPRSAEALALPRQARQGPKTAKLELRARAAITRTTSTHSCHPEGALATEGSLVRQADSSVADPAAQCARSLRMTRHLFKSFSCRPLALQPELLRRLQRVELRTAVSRASPPKAHLFQPRAEPVEVPDVNGRLIGHKHGQLAPIRTEFHREHRSARRSPNRHELLDTVRRPFPEVRSSIFRRGCQKPATFALRAKSD